MDDSATITPQETLTLAFRALSKRQRKNLAWHEKRKTPILCGQQASMFSLDGAG